MDAWLTAAVRAGAMACIAALLTGCSGSSTDDGPTTPTHTGSPTSSGPDTSSDTSSRTADATTPVRFSLPTQYQPNAAQCAPTEVELAEPPASVGLLRACRPPEALPGYLRLVNVSSTTLGYGVGPGREVKAALPPQETLLTDAALTAAGNLMNVNLKTYYNTQTGWLYLPARFSAVVYDNGQLRTVQIVALPAHGRAVSDIRAISRLAAQIPYAKLADQKAIGAKIAGCALQAAKSVDDQKLTFPEAVKDAQTCQKMVDDLRQRWQEQRAVDIRAGRLPEAGLPEDSARILAGLSHETGPMKLEWQMIESTAAKAAAQVRRHL